MILLCRNGVDRKNFNVAKFVLKYNLPYALSFNGLKAEYDEYSDVLKQQLFPEGAAKEEVQIEAIANEEKAVAQIKKTKKHKFTCDEEEHKVDESDDKKPEMNMDKEAMKDEKPVGETIGVKEASDITPTTPTSTLTAKSVDKKE